MTEQQTPQEEPVAELHGRKLALDEGGRPRVDDGGRLVYVDAEAGTEDPAELAPGQGVHTPEVIPEPFLEPENSQPITPADQS